MKKIKLTVQLIILYTCVLLVTIVTFSLILSSWMTTIYTDNYFDRLTETTNSYLSLLEAGVDGDDIDTIDNVHFIVWDYSNGSKEVTTSKYFIEKIGDYQPDGIFNRIKRELEAGPYTTTLHYQTNFIYYAAKSNTKNNPTEFDDYYIFTISDLNVVNTMKRDINVQIMILFFIILGCGMIVIAMWSSIQLSRIKKISSHVQILPDVNYKKSYIDSGKDEIADLSTCIEDLRQKIFKNEETKREIIQNLSHDIKTPLAVIRSYAEAIYDEVEVTSSSKLIIKQTELLEKKVNKLLTLNRLSYLEKNRNFDFVRMNKIIILIVENLKFISDIEFITDLDNSVFLGYYDNLYTVVENIISNALRYAKTKIVITLRKSTLTIYNDGEQIDPKFLDAQFKPYEKGSSGVFGVGMSIVRQTLGFFNLQLLVRNEEVGVSFIIKDPNPLEVRNEDKLK